MNDFSLPHLWAQMGPVPKGVVVILVLMSTYSIAITVERLLAFRRGGKQSLGYVSALAPLLSSPGRLREAVGLEQRWRSSPVARVIATGINEFVRGMEVRLRRGFEQAPVEGVVGGVSRSMERIKERELINLRRGLPSA